MGVQISNVLHEVLDQIKNDGNTGIILLKDSAGEAEEEVKQDNELKKEFNIILWHTSEKSTNEVKDEIKQIEGNRKVLIILDNRTDMSVSRLFPQFYTEKLLKDKSGKHLRSHLYIIEKAITDWKVIKY